VRSIPVATISSGADKLPNTIELISLEVHRELDKIPEAKLGLLDGSVAKREFAVSNLQFFAPGKTISIKLRYEGDAADVDVFEGVVVRHAIETNGEAGSMLRVELKDTAFKLTRGRKSAVFRKSTDKDAIAKVLGSMAGTLAATKAEHPELVQYDASDWDFIVSRADAAGLLVDVHLGKVSLLPMAFGATEHAFDYGLDDTSDLSLEIDASAQWAELESVGWDLAKHELGAPEQASDPGAALGIGDLDAAAIAKLVGGTKTRLAHLATMSSAELAEWASARLARSRLSLLRGRAVKQGHAKYAPGHTAKLAGIGTHFNGKALISSVTHKLDHEGWQTELSFGLSPEPFARTPDIAELPAAGLLPPIRNLQLAKVAPFEADPLGEHRIKIQLPALPSDQGVVWARFMHPDAGKERGFVFWPEAGDEVVVGFLGGDPRQAIVLGALHGKLSLPDHLAPSDTNDMRVIVSRGGSFIRFDDAKHQIVLSTPAGATITLDDDKKTIMLADQNGNGIVLDDKGITISSGSDLNIEASGKVVIKGSAVDVQ
jgi:uncharacterized protein involved in type VI secretion and phage assembly